MDAEDLLLRQFLGIRTDEQTQLSAQWIRSQQRDDGTWATFFGGPPDHSATIEAYAALRLAGDPVDAAHMRRAREYVLDQGGIERSRVFTKIWLSLFGLWSWEHVPAMPPELIFLPPWAPLNLYDFACWARQTVAALTVVWAYRPVREIPITLDELRVGGPPQSRIPVTDPVSKAFVALDRALHAYERRPVRAAAQACAAEDGALDPRASGAGRLLGRDPAAMGLLDHGADAARAIRSITRSSRGRSTGSTASRSSTSRAGGWRRASHPSGTPAWR